ncbi:MAG: DUF3857 domain-containing protein [Xanthomonadales bacterium]|nr:DUF3857 domain-containing protein [Xanthomonadales bacterium]
MQKLLGFLKIFFLTLLTLTAQAKTTEIESLNLTLDFDKNWQVRNHPVAELALINIKTGEVVVVHKQPLHTINSQEQLPKNLNEYKQYIRDNFLKSQLDVITPLFDQPLTFNQNVSANGLAGPMVELSGQINGLEMNFFMWLPWQGNGAYTLNYVSPKGLNRNKRHFQEIINNIKINNPNINPFIVEMQLTIDENNPPFIDPQFNTRLSPFENYIPVSNEDMEIQNDENFYSLMLVNIKNGNFISIIPHCFEINQTEQEYAIKAVADLMLETSLSKKSFVSNGLEIAYYEGSGFNQEIKQLAIQAAMKKVGNCYHTIIFASSNQLNNSSAIKMIYENFRSSSTKNTEILFTNPDQNTALSNFYISIANYVVENGQDGKVFFEGAYQLVQSADALNLLLNQINQSKQYIVGLEHINAAEPSIQNDVAIKSWQAWFLAQTEAFDEAINVYTEIFADNYTSDEDFFYFIELLDKSAHWEQAYKQIEKHLDAITKRSTALAQLVKYAGFSNNEPATLAALKTIEDENRINIENIFDVTDGLYEIKAYDKSIEIINEFIKKYPENLNLHYYKADILTSYGEFTDALIAIEKAQEIAPENKHVQELMKHIQLNIGVGNYQNINTPITKVTTPEVIKSKINQLSFQNRGDAEYLYYSVGIHFEKGKKLKTTYDRKIKVNNLKGLENFKTIQFEYDQSYENVYINQFQVLDKDFNLVKELDIKSVYLSSKQDGITADDDMIINIPVPKLSEDMIISYTITTETKSTQDEYDFQKHFFVSSYPMGLKAVFVTGDTDQIVSESKEPLEVVKQKKLQAWMSSNIPQITFYPLMPYTEDIANWLVINEKNKSWKKVGQEYLEMIDDKLNTKISKAQLLAIFSGAKTVDEKVIKAATYIQQNINYQAIEFGTRALIPNSATETLKKGYGDCKDHAVLLHDLLKAEGIQSNIALVQTSQKISPEAPSLGQFDHAINYIPGMHGGTYIDTTDKEIAISHQLPPQNLMNTQALVLHTEDSLLKLIPSSKPEHSLISIERSIDRDLNHINISETIQMTGYMASGMRQSLKNNQSAELMQNVQSWLSEEYSDLELISFEYYGLGNNQEPLIIEMNSRFETSEAHNRIPFFLEKNYLDKSLSSQRNIPFLLNTPFEIMSETHFESNMDVKIKVPETKENQTPVIQWQLINDKNKLKFKATSNRYKGSAQVYNEFVKTIKKGLKALETTVTVAN